VIVATIRIVVASEKREEILEILLAFKGPTEVKSGCLRCEIFQDLQDGNAIVYKEAWQNKEKLYSHIRSDMYRDLLTVVDMAMERPEIRFYTVSKTTGMDMIKEALGHNESTSKEIAV
jgi:quinol monooxygenase YgiN